MPSRRTILGAGALSALSALVSQSPFARPIVRQGSIAHVDLMEVWRGQRLFIPAKVQGHPTTAMLDTGAELTIIDKSYAGQINVSSGRSVMAKGTGGSADAQLVEGVEIVAAGLNLKLPQVGVIDLADVSRRIVGRPLTLILGRDFFAAARFTIDFETSQMFRVERAEFVPGVKLPLENQRGIDTIPISIEVEPLRADLDLGNGGDILISRAYAQSRGFLTDGRPVTRRSGGGVGGPSERLIINLSSIEVAGRFIPNVEGAIDQTEHAVEANVGIGVLKRFRLTLDISERVVWMEPRSIS